MYFLRDVVGAVPYIGFNALLTESRRKLNKRLNIHRAGGTLPPGYMNYVLSLKLNLKQYYFLSALILA